MPPASSPIPILTEEVGDFVMDNFGARFHRLCVLRKGELKTA